MKKRFLLLWAVCFYIFIGSVKDAFCLDWPPDIDIIEISFNYNSGSTTYDAVTLKANASTYKTVPEWKAGVRNDKVAYIQSQLNRKIKTKFQLDRSGDYIMGVYAEEYQASYGIGDVNETQVSFDGSDKSIPKVMTCDGSVPSGVNKSSRHFYWKWYVTYICEDDVEPEEFDEPLYIGYTGVHNYYTLLAAPQNPMPNPWTEVLDYACDWASGQSSETNALTEITEGAFANFPVDYYGGHTHTPTTTCNLTGIIDDEWADCKDMAAVIHIFTRAIGGSSTQVRRINGPFTTQLIDPIGSPSGWGSTWGTTSWNHHQVAWKSNVWDACLRLDFDDPHIPVNEAIDTTYKNDLYSSGTWSPQTPFSITTVN